MKTYLDTDWGSCQPEHRSMKTSSKAVFSPGLAGSFFSVAPRLVRWQVPNTGGVLIRMLSELVPLEQVTFTPLSMHRVTLSSIEKLLNFGFMLKKSVIMANTGVVLPEGKTE